MLEKCQMLTINQVFISAGVPSILEINIYGRFKVFTLLNWAANVIMQTFMISCSQLLDVFRNLVTCNKQASPMRESSH